MKIERDESFEISILRWIWKEMRDSSEMERQSVIGDGDGELHRRGECECSEDIKSLK